MINVMDHKVTEVLRETEDYFVVFTEEGAAYGALGNQITHIPVANKEAIDALIQIASLEDDLAFEDAIDILILENS